MPVPDPPPQSTESADYTVAIGEHRFDPVDVPARRSRARIERDAGEPDPADTRIVQFHGQLTAADMDRLQAEYGLALTAHVPNFAYVERVDAPTRQRLARDPLVRAVAPYLPEYKLDPMLTAAIDARAEGAEPLMAKAWLFDGGSTDIVVGALYAAGATEIDVQDDRPLGGLATVRFAVDDADVVERATTIDDVRWIEPQPSISVDDVKHSAVIQSGDESNATVWAKGIHGEQQVIGMIDDGVPDSTHCFFDDVAPNTPGPTHRKLLEVRAGAVQRHATFVAGCAVGDQRGNSGAHPNRGSAWAAKLVAGSYTVVCGGSILAELNEARLSGAFIHTNSWHDDCHGPGNPAPYIGIAVDTDTFCYQNEDQLVLGSSGNTTEEQGAPGTAKNALCISAGTTDGQQVGDGNPGPTTDGRMKPDLVAAGCDITSATNGTACGTHSRPCRTSYATPHAAGAAALARQYFTEGWHITGSKDTARSHIPTAALLRAVLVNSAVNMPGVASYPNMTEGWGIIRLDRCLSFAGSGTNRNLVIRDIRNANGLRQGETATQNYTVSGDLVNQLRVVLAYTEPPGTIGSPNPANTHLRLRVTDPNGVVYVGNDFDPTVGLSRPNSTSNGDPLNNIEVVLVNAPPHGAWRIEVTAVAVQAATRQGFAVAATAGAAPASVTKKGCFVATAVYGDPGHPDVVALRRWRDRHLAGPPPARWLMHAFAATYERLGPHAAEPVTRRPRLRAALRDHVFPRIARRLRWQ